MKSPNLNVFLLMSCLLIFSCKGEDGEMGPAGPSGNSDPNTGLLIDGGVVSGTISTSRTDNTAENFSFEYKYNFEKNYFDGSELSVAYVNNFVSGYSHAIGHAYLSLNTSDLSTVPTTYRINLSAIHDYGNGTAFLFEGTDSDAITETTSSISNWSYNATDHTVSFNVNTATGYQGANGKDADVSINVSNIPVTSLFLRTAK